MTSKSAKQHGQSGTARTIVLGVIFLGLVGVLTLALYGWSNIYSHYLERTPPVILFDQDQPRGIGISPVSVGFTVSEARNGVDEVVVRVHQKGASREILRRSLKGEHEAHISIDFPGEKSNLEEGSVQLEVKAFDRSFWSNSAEKSIMLQIDYRKPKIEPITLMHNARRGGSQLVFYRAFDQSLAFSGIRVGNETFLGFPARGIDKSFEDSATFVALYAVDMRQTDQNPPVRLFGQDMVGNASSAAFANRILPRPDRVQAVTLNDQFLLENVADIAEGNFAKMRSFASDSGIKLEYTTAAGSTERSLEQFKFINQYLRVLNEQELVGVLKKGGRFEHYWTGPFEQENATVTSTFGDTVDYRYQNQSVGTRLQTGYEFSMSKNVPDVIAVADGVVIFSENIGVYGRLIGIDHGLGLVSIYAQLDTISVKEGQTVKAGDVVATAGRTGLARTNGFYFELRLQGVPVDPREWWDKSWFFGHIVDQTNSAKKLLEIPSGPSN